ncbi:hypothetical protein OIV83_000305 [Microbotryomycetes sp. JL201]|nr:hypothetical protein OIV83_000305 [Microbotryomycetes sp. JL201]
MKPQPTSASTKAFLQTSASSLVAIFLRYIENRPQYRRKKEGRTSILGTQSGVATRKKVQYPDVVRITDLHADAVIQSIKASWAATTADDVREAQTRKAQGTDHEEATPEERAAILKAAMSME